MKVLQTKRQIEKSKSPTKLDVLRELNKRDALDQDLKDELKRLEHGYAGEQTVLKLIKEFGEEHWVVMQKLWLDYYGKFECDLLLLTNAGLYPFEIKNYSGTFEFRNSQCLINGKRVGHNAIAQAQKVTINLENIIKQHFFDTSIQGAIAFIGHHNEVIVDDEIEDIQIVMANQLRKHIWNIAKEERNFQGRPIDIQGVVRKLAAVETDNPFNKINITEDIKKRVKKGIRCSYCGSFAVDASKSYIICKCKMHEPREEAIVRTICEYGVINHNEDLTTAALVDFFDGAISRKNLSKFLNRHFVRIGSNKSTRYINKKLPFNLIYSEFHLPLPKYLTLHGPYSQSRLF